MYPPALDRAQLPLSYAGAQSLQIQCGEHWGTLTPASQPPPHPLRLLELTSHLHPTCARDSEAQGRKLLPPSTVAEILAQATSWVSHTDVGHLART